MSIKKVTSLRAFSLITSQSRYGMEVVFHFVEQCALYYSVVVDVNLMTRSVHGHRLQTLHKPQAAQPYLD